MKNLFLSSIFALFALFANAQDFSAIYKYSTTKYTLHFRVNEGQPNTCSIIPGSSIPSMIRITFPTTVTYESDVYSISAIAPSAFAGYNNLLEIHIHKNIESIGDAAFFNCYKANIGLNEATSLRIIGKNAFQKADKVSGILSAKIESIGEYAYAETRTDALEYFSSADVPAFCFFKNITARVDFYGNVRSIGESAFEQCSEMGTAILPNSLVSLGKSAFKSCLLLKEIDLPAALESIGDEAFAGCSSLKTVTYLADNPIAADKSVFDEDTYSNATLYVSEAGYVTACNTAPWMYFSNIEKYKSAGINKIENSTSADEIDFTAPYNVYTLSGVLAGHSKDELLPGIYIIVQGLKTLKIAVK